MDIKAEPAGTLKSLLTLQQTGADIFCGSGNPGADSHLYGGQVLGQAMMAAARTVPDGRAAHSLQGVFMRPGNPDLPVSYHVTRTRDGRSFATRQVSACQAGQALMSLSLSFHIVEPGFHHQPPMPDVPPPEDLTAEEVLAARTPDLPGLYRHRMQQRNPLEIRPVRPAPPLNRTPQPPVAQIWVRSRDPLGEDPGLHRAALAYLSDYGLLGAALLPYGWTYDDPGMHCASLDHALWLHREARADDWLLYAMEGPSAGGARIFTQGRIFTRAGEHVATVCQEGLARCARDGLAGG